MLWICVRQTTLNMKIDTYVISPNCQNDINRHGAESVEGLDAQNKIVYTIREGETHQNVKHAEDRQEARARVDGHVNHNEEQRTDSQTHVRDESFDTGR